MKTKLVVPIPEEKEVVSRTRSRATVLSLADIMFNCQLEKGLQKGMIAQVDALVKTVCSRGVDEYKLAEYVFDTHRNSFMIGDMGHMAVLGYIIKKYISADNDYLKDFLREMEKEVSGDFDHVCKRHFGLIVVRKKNGTLCFRKATGMCV